MGEFSVSFDILGIASKHEAEDDSNKKGYKSEQQMLHTICNCKSYYYNLRRGARIVQKIPLRIKLKYRNRFTENILKDYVGMSYAIEICLPSTSYR